MASDRISPKKCSAERPESARRIFTFTSERMAALRTPRKTESRLERGRCIDPQDPGFDTAGIFPAVRHGTLEIEAVAGLQDVMFVAIEPDFEYAAKDVKELFAFVGVGFAAATTGLDAEEVRLHSSIAPGEKLHANAGRGFEDLPLRGPDEALGFAFGFEEGNDVGFVETGDALKGRDGAAHLAALESAEKADGDAGGVGDLGEREAPTKAEAAEFLTGRVRGVGGSGDDTLFFQDVDDSGGIEAAISAEKDGALKKADIGLGVKAIFALGAVRSDEAEGLPGAQSRGRDADTAGNLADAEEASGGQSFRCFGQILSA